MGVMICESCGYEELGGVICPNDASLLVTKPPEARPAALLDETVLVPLPREHGRDPREHSDAVTVCDCGMRYFGDRCPTCQRPGGTAAASALPRLVLPGGAAVPLADGVAVLIGREAAHPAIRDALAECDVVSRRHATVTLRGDRIVVEDHSMNGTFVDGRPLGSVAVERGLPVSIRLGSSSDSVTLEVR